jgi:uncharacterized protein YecE (DUF72 family)
MTELRIGTAGWSIPLACAAAFPVEGSGLERYAAIFSCAEINSSFHRSHRAATWGRWAASAPEGFRFSAKLSKQVTHVKKLVDCEAELEAAVTEMKLLGESLGVILVQLPPSLAFDEGVALSFFTALRTLWDGGLACEPRHASWFEREADQLLASLQIARVAADPAKVPEAAEPGGWPGLGYYRLHGSPRMYRSSYDDGRLEPLAVRLAAHRDEGRETWCIFDNTASSAAGNDALKVQALTSR